MTGKDTFADDDRKARADEKVRILMSAIDKPNEGDDAFTEGLGRAFGTLVSAVAYQAVDIEDLREKMAALEHRISVLSGSE